MLAGLRQHGNFPLPARADMNDVLAALARAAGWTVQPDGTTFRSSNQPLLPPPPPQLVRGPSVNTPLLPLFTSSTLILSSKITYRTANFSACTSILLIIHALLS
jgi:beta-amylase